MANAPSSQPTQFQQKYVRKPEPLVFPVEAEVPESKRHLELRTALYLIMKYAFAERAVLGSDQFVYWDPSNPRACLAPDLLVQLGKPDEDFDTWKIWQRGAPDVAVEIASRSDAPEPNWEEKLAQYKKVGLKELVRFDHKNVATPLRIWDYVEGDLVERVLDTAEARRSTVLEHYWFVTSDRWLRLAKDADGAELLQTPDERATEQQKRAQAEAERAQAEAERAQTEAQRAQTEAQRAQTEAQRADAAEQENLRLRAELARLQGK
jgi:Uma2 family endonuclease